MSVSRLARDVWRRLGHWYGVDALEQKFGSKSAPPDWAKAIDAIGKHRIDLVLADLKSKYPKSPCSLPEFEAFTANHRPRAMGANNGPSNSDRLADYALRALRLTKMQRIAAWQYLHDGNEIVGLEIPADRDTPGHRIMVQDLEALAQIDSFQNHDNKATRGQQ